MSDVAQILSRAAGPFREEMTRLRPSGAAVIEAHSHLGADEDGRTLAPDELHAMLDADDVGRAVVFPLHDPERRPAYRLPNDRVLAWAQESDGRFVPFCRLDPAEDPISEAERCLERGARGIKLHPRAQAFAFADGAADDIFGLAEQASVPILIHAGRGMPPIADGLADLALRHPGAPLILAHAAIADQGVLTSRLAGHPAVLYDTSCFSAFDILGLLARAPAERIVYGSDPPYGRPLTGLYLLLRCAAAAGIDEMTLDMMLGGTMARLLAGEPLAEPTAPRRSDELVISGRLARAYAYGTVAFGALLGGGTVEGAKGALDLMAASARDPEPAEAGAALERISETVEAALAIVDDPDGRWPAFGLMHLCLSMAATESAIAAL
jgi:predicted TIM-barrel fold metal-dependent hydrolase